MVETIPEPLVSILMPNFNKEGFLVEAIKSVIAQTYRNWELVIIDDGSHDDSWSLIAELKNTDSRITSYRLENTKGSGAARNEGLKHVKGELVAFLDSDDVWHAHKLALQVAFMIENNSALCTTHTEIINFQGKTTGLYQPLMKQVGWEEMLAENFVSTSATMVNCKQVGQLFFPPLRYCQDYACWMKQVQAGHKIDILPHVTISHRIEPRLYLIRKIPKAYYRWRVYRDYLGLSYRHSLINLTRYAVSGLRKSLDYTACPEIIS